MSTDTGARVTSLSTLISFSELSTDFDLGPSILYVHIMTSRLVRGLAVIIITFVSI